MVAGNRQLVVGGVICVVFVVMGVAGPYITPYSPFDGDTASRLATPSLAHPFGTDAFGRDVLSRLMAGTRYALVTGVGAIGLAVVIGACAGLIAGYFRGWIDEVLMRLTDVALAVPSVILALVIVTSLGSSVRNLVIAIGAVYAPRIARVVRSRTLEIRERDFVVAARARGENHLYVMAVEIGPHTASALAVEASMRMSFVLLLQAALSFLGLGLSPPAPDWGLMISGSRLQMYSAPWLIVFPSLVITITIVGFNMLGDGIVSATDRTLDAARPRN
ncbi:MAG: ABC transporter permease subunit [Streptosporangiales bacterium]|nr:ABC transporter permease subunit [Streptosporangiales bacterium]